MSPEGNRPPDHDDHHKFSSDPLTALIREVSLSSFRIDQIDKKFDEVFKEFREEIKGLRTTHVLRAEHEHLDVRVKKIEEIISWGIKIVFGIILTAAVGMVMSKGGGPFR